MMRRSATLLTSQCRNLNCSSNGRAVSSAVRCSTTSLMTQHRRSIHSTTQLLSEAAEASVKTEEAGASVKTEEPEAEPEELTEEQRMNAQIEELLERNTEELTEEQRMNAQIEEL